MRGALRVFLQQKWLPERTVCWSVAGAKKAGAVVRKRSWLDELREKNDKARQQKKKPAPSGAAWGQSEGMSPCLDLVSYLSDIVWGWC